MTDLTQETEKTVASMIREAVERKGYKDMKACTRAIRVPYDLFNKVVGGHIPKDAQLVEYAGKLEIDHRALLLAAYKQKAPEDMKRYFNAITLLEDHDPQVGELLTIIDGLTQEQLDEVLAVAQMIRRSPRQDCRKATALLGLYQELEADMMSYFESLVLLALRHEPSHGAQTFRDAVASSKPSRANRR